ncbi:MAG: hypothetical protein J1F35_00675 [Erysipelotrichales bacterium]|nr:hypothetical protein [Erysipelotrichales bacterium]
MHYNIDLIQLQNSLYNKKKSYNHFINISPEKVDELKQEAALISDDIFKDIPRSVSVSTVFYIKVLQMMTSKRFWQRSFDEVLIIYIFVIDPDLTFYKLYRRYFDVLKTNNVFKDDEKKYNEKKNNQLHLLKNDIFNRFGYSDLQIINYEKDFYKIFIKAEQKKEEGQNEETSQKPQTSKKNYLINLMDLLKDIKSLDSITQERYKEILELAEEYKNTYGSQVNIDELIWNLLYKNTSINLETLEEKILFFVYLFDPELIALTIYEEECKWDNIKSRMMESFGYFHKDIIRLEKLYKKRNEL